MRFLSLLLALACVAAAPPPSRTVTLAGIGPLRVGLTAAQLQARFGARLVDTYPDPEAQCSYWEIPSWPGLGLMVIGNRLVRIDIESPDWVTRSGARVGMAESDILRLYGAAMRVEPHPYTEPDGKYLVYRAASEPYGLIVETLGGKAESMRVGYWENVQWIEGCS